MRAAFWTLIAISGATCAAAPIPPNEATHLIATFDSVCVNGATDQKAELARADALGWRSSGSDAPKGFDPATQRLSPSGSPTLVLTTVEEESSAEMRDICGISSTGPVKGLSEAAQDWLGFSPIFASMGSATFVALRDGSHWRASPKLDRTALQTVKREGMLYSIMVLNGDAPEKDKGYSATISFLRALQKS